MKRLALLVFLAAFPPTILLGSTQHYIVITAHPYDEAVRRLPREDFDPSARASLHARPFHVINGFDAELTDDQLKRLIASGEVEDIETVIERHAMADTITAGQQTTPYGVSAVHAPDVWPVTKGAAINGTGPIHVAVIDTGIDYHSPELQAAYKGGHNFITGSDDPLDDFGHGTHVSGIIAAADDRQGVVGVAPAVDIFSLKILDQCGSGNTSNVIHAIDWIIAKKQAIGGNWIANLSLGSDQSSLQEKNAFQNGTNQGIIFFAASGNSYDTNPVDGLAFPGGYPTVVSVGAVDLNDKVAVFSQRGPDLKVVAPGVAVLSTIIAASVTTSDGRAFAGNQPVIVKNSALEPLDGYCLPTPNVSSSFVFCGFGGSAADFPSSVRGKIALIQRGKASSSDPDITFKLKALNAQTAGAIGVIVYDNVPPDDPNAAHTPAFGTYTTSSAVPQFLPYLLIDQPDGQALKATPNVTVTLGFGFEGFATENGTSMATPHATAVAALAWATAPNASPSDVQNAVINTAIDLGDAGVDNVYGHGLVDALSAAKQLNPGAFGSPATPPPPTGRPPGRRGQ